jgi:hypothetical protein
MLWAVPRSISTAFERVFLERGDFEVIQEPFSLTYYFSTERRSDRFSGEGEPREEYDHRNVLRHVLEPREKPVFVQDMAYYAAGFMTPEFVDQFANTFIVREPRGALVSLHKVMPGFTFEEAGYRELHRLYSYATEGDREAVIVVDAEDFLEDPEGTARAYCEALGIPFAPEALSWEVREVPEWRIWDAWHTAAKESTGIGRVSRRETALPPELEETYERCLPYYEKLRARRLRPAGTWGV